MSENKNPKCEATISDVQCDTEYPDFWQTTYRWAGRKYSKIECLNHAAYNEQNGRRVELIDQR